MGEEASKSKGKSDDELFDIAVRRDDTKSLDEIVDKKEDKKSEPEEIEPMMFDHEKEVTRPENTGEEPVAGVSISQENSESEAPRETREEAPAQAAPVEQPTPVQEKAQPVAAAPKEPVVEGTATHVVEHRPSGSGTLVLQWLTYAFWGWFAAALTLLASITFGYFIGGSDARFWGDSLAYPLAAVIVMLVIALTTDYFYAHREPVHKHGGASVIMLIHAVIYMLAVVAALIGIVFGVISIVITADPINTMDGIKVFMLTAAVAMVVFGSISLRALFAGKKRGVRKMFWLLMSVLALGFVIASIAGPAMKANSTKDDRLIEMALPSLASDIGDYTRENDMLPASIDQVKSSFSGAPSEQVQRMVDQGLVTYKPNSRPVKFTPSVNSTSRTQPTCTTDAECKKLEETKPTNSMKPVQIQTGIKTFYYQLCVTYKEAKNSKYYSNRRESDDYVSTTVSTYTHPKGEVCYDVSATGKYSSTKF